MAERQRKVPPRARPAAGAERRAALRYGRLPLAVEREVRLLCAGYRRRALSMGDRSLPIALLAEYRRKNRLIDEALEESCEGEIRELIREDIAVRRGEMYSQIWWLGVSTYKKRKQAAKHAIARRFGLLK